MIRINRGAEPGKLAPIRSKKLEIAAAHAKSGTLDRKDHVTGYDVVKMDLCLAQNRKCCYCERNNLEAAHLDVEHFRPAMEADRGPGFPTYGYWWLAWTWNNLMFSCNSCNCAKGYRFPLDAASVALVEGQSPPGLESPLLIDPSRENPMDHIRFQLKELLGRPRWGAHPRRRSFRGRITIEVLKLNREELLDLYARHVRDQIDPVIRRLLARIADGDGDGIREIWDEQLMRLVTNHGPFAALSHDAVDHFIPRAIRTRWKLRLSRP